MKLLKAEVHNFGSYSHLEFDFSNLGLALIHGDTGSGKSTLQDIAPWILFGTTAKDGNADEIRSWTNPEDITLGRLDLIASDGSRLTVRRIRGKPAQNDLCWFEKDQGETVSASRGKDITETQKLLEERLGVSKDLYIAGAYYNEFSPTGAFFTAKAKDRRELFENLADLELAKTIAERTSNAKKDTKKTIEKSRGEHSRLSGHCESSRLHRLDVLSRSSNFALDVLQRVDSLHKASENFEEEKRVKIASLKSKSDAFEKHKEETLKALENNALQLEQQILQNPEAKCSSCGQVNSKITRDICRLEELEKSLKDTAARLNPYTLQLKDAEAYENHYNQQIEAERSKVNPFISQISKIESDLQISERKLGDLDTEIKALEHRLASLQQLNDLSFELRGALLNQAVKEIETSTNKYLETYFESELRVGFELEGSDDLTVSITKNGYQGVYKQLSKGQRGLLKLAFSVSVMQSAANSAGVHFGTLFFDESLDGLDQDLKVKAFSLFSELEISHESVLVVEHSTEFKALFTKSFLVTMSNDVSTISEE